MSSMCILNMVINGVLTLGFSAFLVFLFGRENSLIHKLGKANTAFVKIILSMCAAGALYNVVIAHEPEPSELILNGSIAALFCWASVFHYCRFVKPQVNAPQYTKVIKKRVK